jgi:hypothetical protein
MSMGFFFFNPYVYKTGGGGGDLYTWNVSTTYTFKEDNFKMNVSGFDIFFSEE